MSNGTAKINVTPSTSVAQRNMAVEMVSMARRTRSQDFKYNYDFGFRKISDSLIDLKQDTFQWDTPKNVELILRCNAERDQLISYVDIKLDQSSNEHNARIIAGGIGQGFIEILVTARDTYWFKYDARFYGNPTWLRVRLDK